MKFTLSWLKDHLETEATVDALSEALTDLGLEVEGIEDPTAQLGAFRICRVIEAVQHPNADRLRVCRVETYPDGPGGRVEEVRSSAVRRMPRPGWSASSRPPARMFRARVRT
jgi:phenylalanyl-tRNA synthetase beta chain